LCQMYKSSQSSQGEYLVQHPFELGPEELTDRLEEMVQVTISDLTSEFLLLPL